jgi:DNA-binding transcriptional regulator LsrR (DeoR family)
LQVEFSGAVSVVAHGRPAASQPTEVEGDSIVEDRTRRTERLDATDYDTARLINKILTLYYIEELTQAEIARRLGLSTPKVNRLIKQARQQGLVNITIRTAYQHLFSLESRLKAIFGLEDAVVIPAVSDSSDAVIRTLGQAAAAYLLEHVRDGDIIGIAAGQAILALIQAADAPRPYDVTVVPMVGGVQGLVTSDVNYLATELGSRLGGKAYQLHAPAFVETREHRDALLAMEPIRKILDVARQATIALVGIGILDPETSRFVKYSALSRQEMDHIINVHGGVGDIASHIYNLEGRLCAPEYDGRAVCLTMDEIQHVPLIIGMAATAAKVLPVYGALRGGYLRALVTDEAAAEGVVQLFEQDFRGERELPRSKR